MMSTIKTSLELIVLSVIILCIQIDKGDSHTFEEKEQSVQTGCEFEGAHYQVGSRVESYEEDCMDQCVCRAQALGWEEAEIFCQYAKVCENRLQDCPTGSSTLWTKCGCPYCYKDPFIMHIYQTRSSYYYQYHQIALATNRIFVHIDATNDAYLALSAEPRDLANMYEIVIGGWANRYCVIRRCKQCQILAWATTVDILPSTKAQYFWLRFDDGVIAVGLSGWPSFLQYQDPDPLPVHYVGVTTRLGSTGKFTFRDLDAFHHISENFEPNTEFVGCSPVVTVDDKNSPAAIAERISASLFLYISSDADVTVNIFNDNKPNTKEIYRVVMGYGPGAMSAIMQCSGDQCKEVFSALTFNLFGKDRFYGFWLDVGQSTEGAITFGRDGHPAFLSYRYPVSHFSSDGSKFYLSLSVQNHGSANFRLCL